MLKKTKDEKMTLALIALAHILLAAVMLGALWVTDYYAGGMKERIEGEQKVVRNLSKW